MHITCRWKKPVLIIDVHVHVCVGHIYCICTCTIFLLGIDYCCLLGIDYCCLSFQESSSKLFRQSESLEWHLLLETAALQTPGQGLREQLQCWAGKCTRLPVRHQVIIEDLSISKAFWTRHCRFSRFCWLVFFPRDPFPNTARDIRKCLWLEGHPFIHVRM